MAVTLTRRVLLVAICVATIVIGGCASSPRARLLDLATLQHRADAAYAKHDWRNALVAYKALTTRVPDNSAYWFRLGNCYARLSQPMPAADAFRAALQRNPHIVPAWHNLGSVLLKQSQAAYRQAVANAGPGDALRHRSALLAARIDALRKGGSTMLSHKAQAGQIPADAGAAPAPASSLTIDGNGGG